MMLGKPRDFTPGGKWEGQVILCHLATLIWLYEREFQRTPTLAQYTKFAPSYNTLLSRMMGMGQRLQRPPLGSTRLTAGTVLIFESGGQAMHSCMAIDNFKTGGYNQTTWFAKPGKVTLFSEHETAEIKWRGPQFPGQTGGERDGVWYNLIAVPEGPARGLVRQASQA